MKRNFELIICLFIIVFSVLSHTVSSETGEDYSPINDPKGDQYWGIIRWDEILQVDAEGNVNISVKIMLEFYNKTSDIWFISFDLGPNITNPVLHYNNHSKFIDKAEFVLENHRTILKINFNSSINSFYTAYSLGFSYQSEESLIVEKVSAFYEMTNRFRLLNRISFFPNLIPQTINYYIVLPSRASLHRHNVKIEENVEIPKNHFFLWYFDPDFLHTDSDDSFIKVPDVEDYHISKISIGETFEETFPGKRIFIEYTTPNDDIGILIIVAAVFSILGFIIGIITILTYKNRKKAMSKLIIKKEKILESGEIETIKVTKPNNIDKLDTLLLTIPSIIGILGLFIQIILNVFISFNEIIYYITVPILFFAIFMPIYFGYWRGALVKNSILERTRGWIYLVSQQFSF